MLIDRAELIVEGSAGPVSFETEGGASWKVWDRYLAIDGKTAFHIGNICGTCAFFFQRLEGANRSIDAPQVAAELNAGLTRLAPGVVDAWTLVVPNGTYRVLLQQVTPTLVKPGTPEDYFTKEAVELWGLDPFLGRPHHPQTEYYRLTSRPLPAERSLYEFLIPMFPRRGLKAERVAEYSDARAGTRAPTAVALSVLDTKEPHWCLAHYLLDGHHKVFAASQTGRPLTLLSFLAMDHGTSSGEEVAELLEILAT